MSRYFHRPTERHILTAALALIGVYLSALGYSLVATHIAPAPAIVGATWANEASPTIVYASKGAFGLPAVPAIASIANPQAGPDGSLALQALLNLNAAGQPLAGQPVKVIVDIRVACHDIALDSGDTLAGTGAYESGITYNGSTYSGTPPQAGLWYFILTGSSTSSCVIRNANWISNYNAGSPSSSPTGCANIVDQNIRVEHLYIDGQRRNSSGGTFWSPFGTALANGTTGQAVIPVQFCGVQGLFVDGLSVFDPCYSHIFVSNISFARLSNIRVLDAVWLYGGGAHRGTEGIQIHGPIQDFQLRGMAGTTADDFVTLTTAGANVSNTGGSNPLASGFGPWIWGGSGGYSVTYGGNVVDVLVDGLQPLQSTNACAIYCDGDARTSVSWVMKNVTVTNVTGSVSNAISATDLGYYGLYETGCIRSGIVLSNWNLRPASFAFGGLGYTLGGTWNDLTILHHTWQDTSSTTNSHQVLPLSTFNCARLVIDGYQIVQDASGPANPATPIAISAGTFGDVAIRNCAMDLHGTSSTNFCAVSGGTIASLTFKGCEFNYANSVLTYTAGTISQLGSTGLTHRNAGAAAYVLTNSTAIPRMVASGTDATTLYSGTAPTILQAGSP